MSRPDPCFGEPSATASLVAHAAAALTGVRARRPRVHCLTNPVALELSANMLLAVGAEPSLTGHAAAVAEFVRASDALVVNLGMLEPQRAEGILAATDAARAVGRPWLLDPVKVEQSAPRRQFTEQLLLRRPTVLRGNGAEIAALAGNAGDPVSALSRRIRAVVAQTGPVDIVTDGTRRLDLTHGSPLMDRVTAMGCAASALTGAFLAVEPDPFQATAAALLVLGLAGEIAAARARGPGSFVPELLDTLFTLDAAAMGAQARRP